MPHPARASLLACLLAVAAPGCRDRAAREPARTVAAAPPPERSIGTGDVLAIRGLLLADDFAGLDARLAWRADSARTDPGYEGRYRAAFDVFDTGDPSLGPHLDAWVRHGPISPTAHMARATWRIAKAASARGAGPGETSKSQLDAMFHWGELAKQDLESAQGADATNVLTYFELMGIAMWYGEPAERRKLLDDGLAQVPGSLLLRLRYLHSVRPRWGGSLEQMEAQVREADSAAARWPRLRVLHGFIAYDDAASLYDRGDYAGAAKRYTEALRSGDTWQYRADRANALFHLRRYQDAIGDYGEAVAERPAMVEALAWRAAAYDYLAWDGSHDDRRNSLFALGRRDLELAASFDSTNASVQRVLTGHPTLRPRQAP